MDSRENRIAPALQYLSSARVTVDEEAWGGLAGYQKFMEAVRMRMMHGLTTALEKKMTVTDRDVPFGKEWRAEVYILSHEDSVSIQ